MRKLLVAVFGILALAAPARAQDYKPVDVQFGFGWAFPVSSGFKASFDSGWNGTIGGAFNFNPKMGVQVDYTYQRFDGPSKTIPVSTAPGLAALTNGLLESNQQVHSG